MNDITTEEYRLKKFIKEAKKDFKVFLKYTYKFLKLPEPTEIHNDVAEFLQQDDRRRMIQAYRGLGKTTITSVYVCWRLFNNPELKFLIVSANSSLAEDIASQIKKILSEMPLTRHLDPDKTDKSSVTKFNVNGLKKIDKQPSVKILGITSSLNGNRADEIIADDIETQKNSLTQTQREGILHNIKEFDSIIKSDGESKITYLGTPQTEDSIYTKLGTNFKIRVWPARYPKLDKLKNYKDNLSEIIYKKVLEDSSLEWMPTNPKQSDEEDLYERELSSGKSNFLLQYMLDTSLTDAERFPLKMSDLIVFDTDIEVAPMSLTWSGDKDKRIDGLNDNAFAGDYFHKPMWVNEQWRQYEGSVMAIDPSGKGEDETAYAVVKSLHGYLYVVDCGAIEGGYTDEALTHLTKIAKDNKVNLILTEENYGGGMFEKMLSEFLKKFYPCAMESVWNSKQKELRIIDTLEPVMNRHKLVMNTKILRDDNLISDRDYSLVYQMTRISKQKGSLKHDDRLDALAMAVEYWVESLGRDEEEAIRLIEQEQREKDLKNFLQDYRHKGDKSIRNNGNYNAIGKRR